MYDFYYVEILWIRSLDSVQMRENKGPEKGSLKICHPDIFQAVISFIICKKFLAIKKYAWHFNLKLLKWFKNLMCKQRSVATDG